MKFVYNPWYLLVLFLVIMPLNGALIVIHDWLGVALYAVQVPFITSFLFKVYGKLLKNDLEEKDGAI